MREACLFSKKASFSELKSKIFLQKILLNFYELKTCSRITFNYKTKKIILNYLLYNDIKDNCKHW